MKYTFFMALVALVMTSSCKQASSVGETLDGNFYGEKFELGSPVTVDALRTKMDTQDTVRVNVGGIVESVCQKKGCWTNIATSADAEETVFVKFKDYGFFLPMDCQGQDVVLTGMAFIEETSVEELRHYAEDEGLPEEEIAAIVDSEIEYKFIASGAFIKNKH